jgi:hypothetical protein
MTLLKTSILFVGLAVLGIACGSDSNNSPDAPTVGGNGGAKTDVAIVPGTGGVTGTGGATITPSAGGAGGGVDVGAGGAVVVIDGAAGGSAGTIDGGVGGAGGGGGTVGLDAGIDGGTPSVTFDKPTHLTVINAATTGGLDVTGPAAVPYTTCK